MEKDTDNIDNIDNLSVMMVDTHLLDTRHMEPNSLSVSAAIDKENEPQNAKRVHDEDDDDDDDALYEGLPEALVAKLQSKYKRVRFEAAAKLAEKDQQVEEQARKAEEEKKLRYEADAKARAADAKAEEEKKLRYEADAKAEEEKKLRYEADTRAQREAEEKEKILETYETIDEIIPDFKFRTRFPKDQTTTITYAEFPKVETQLNPYPHNDNIKFEDLVKPKISHLKPTILDLGATNEFSVQICVRALFLEVLQLYPPLNMDTISVQGEYPTLADLDDPTGARNYRIDLVIVRKRAQIPFFMIEVKKPGLWDDDKTKKLQAAYKQIYRYLLVAKRQYGMETPYGMLSTYDQFQVCWLTKDEGSLKTPILQVSKVFDSVSPQNHREVVVALTSAVWDAYSTKKVPYKCYAHGYYQCFYEDSTVRESIRKDVHFEMAKDTKKLFILEHFDVGAEGKAFRVCDSTGAQAVVKFYEPTESNESVEELCEKEKGLWKQINGIEISTCTLNNQLALLMPYLEPVSDREKSSFVLPTPATSDNPSDGSDSRSPHPITPAQPNGFRDEVTAVYKSLVELGYGQTDASWRHIGWYHHDGLKTLKLLDFGHLSSDTEYFSVEKMISNLDLELEGLDFQSLVDSTNEDDESIQTDEDCDLNEDSPDDQDSPDDLDLTFTPTDSVSPPTSQDSDSVTPPTSQDSDSVTPPTSQDSDSVTPPTSQD